MDSSTGLPEIFTAQDEEEWKQLNDAIRIANHLMHHDNDLQQHLNYVFLTASHEHDFNTFRTAVSSYNFHFSYLSETEAFEPTLKYAATPTSKHPETILMNHCLMSYMRHARKHNEIAYND